MTKIQCKLFGHYYVVSRKVTYHVKEYTCKTCQKQLTTNGNGQLIELSPKFKEINDVLERVHYKRKEKIKNSTKYDNLLVFKH